jgi:hypothetical protein
MATAKKAAGKKKSADVSGDHMFTSDKKKSKKADAEPELELDSPSTEEAIADYVAETTADNNEGDYISIAQFRDPEETFRLNDFRVFGQYLSTVGLNASLVDADDPEGEGRVLKSFIDKSFWPTDRKRVHARYLDAYDMQFEQYEAWQINPVDENGVPLPEPDIPNMGAFLNAFINGIQSAMMEIIQERSPKEST